MIIFITSPVTSKQEIMHIDFNGTRFQSGVLDADIALLCTGVTDSA